MTKSNVLPKTDGLYQETAERVVRAAGDLQFEHFHVDDAARRLVRFPKSMDVVLCMNIYGDILSDLGAETAGGLGPGAVRLLRRRRLGVLRVGARLGARHRGPRHRQPDRDDPVGGADARPRGLRAPRPSGCEAAVARVYRDGKTLTPDQGGSGHDARHGRRPCSRRTVTRDHRRTARARPRGRGARALRHALLRVRPATLEAAAREALAFPAPFGFTLRYAMKANPSLGILKLFRELGLHLDASSDFEVERAMRAGFAPSEIQLTSQMPSRRLPEFLAKGVLFNACSLHQLEAYGQIARGREVSVRMNPGLGSGSTNRTNTGGPASSFGIWHEYLGDVKGIADRHDLKITRLHSHIGSGTDPEVWKRVTRMTLDLAASCPTSPS